MWAKLRWELALTERAFAIDAEAAQALERAGLERLAFGAQLSPAIRAYVVSRAQLAGVPLGAELALRADALAAVPAVVLVRFDLAAPPRGGQERGPGPERDGGSG